MRSIGALELATIIGSVERANRVISQVQQKLEALAGPGERAEAIGTEMTFAGSLICAAGGAREFAEGPGMAMSFQDVVARPTVLLPTGIAIRDLTPIQEFAIAQSRPRGYRANEVADSDYMRQASFSAQRAIVMAPLRQQVAIDTHRQLTALMQAPGRFGLNYNDHTDRAIAEFLRLQEVTARLKMQFQSKDLEETSAALSEMINNTSERGAMDKLSIPLRPAKNDALDSWASLDSLLASIGAHHDLVSGEKLATLPGSGGRPEFLIKQLGKLGAIQGALEVSAIGAVRTLQVAKSSISGRLQVLKNNLSIEKKLRAEVSLAMTNWIGNLTSDVHAGPDFLSRHQTIPTMFVYPAARGYDLKHIEELKQAAGKITDATARFFVDRLAPIAEGPFRDVKLSPQISMTFTPVPVAFPVEPAHTIAQPFGGISRASGGITVNYAPTINISSSGSPREEWLKTARQHADELLRIIQDKLSRQARLSFV